MTKALPRWLRLAVETDSTATLVDEEWQARCVHCRTRLAVDREGRPLGSTTLEHIVPRSWFGLREAATLTADLSGPEDAANLALACARCNQEKGRGPDAAGPGDPQAHELVERLLQTRRTRLRPPPAD